MLNPRGPSFPFKKKSTSVWRVIISQFTHLSKTSSLVDSDNFIFPLGNYLYFIFLTLITFYVRILFNGIQRQA